MEIDNFLQLVQTKTMHQPKRSGQGYSACCPAHDDEQPSLSIAEDNDKVLVHCFAGCDPEAICASLGISVSDLFNSTSHSRESTRTVYPYLDENGQEVFRKIRIEPGFNGRDKSFYYERLNANGETVRNLHGCRKILYRLPDVKKGISEAKLIFLVEGEKNADTLAGHGFCATTSPESLKWEDEFTHVLKDADVVLLYDMDDTGLTRKELLCNQLYSRVKRLRVVDLPGLTYKDSHGQDISDWLVKGHTTAELIELINKTSDYEAPRPNGLRVVSLDEFLTLELPKREMILSPFLPSQGLAMIFAKRGVGKTHIALGIASAVARGGQFLKWEAPYPRKVLFIDGEMPAAAIQERLKRIAVCDEFDEQTRKNLRLITPDLQEGPMPDLSTHEGRKAIEDFVNESDLIIIDNISSLFSSGEENEAGDWQPAQDWALALRKKGKSVLFIHHAGKGGNQRGTSKREDILDTVINLKHPADYRPEQGARFEIHYEKTRHFTGESAESFQAHLREDPSDGLLHWDIADMQIDPKVIQVAELSKQGCTIAAIGDQMQLTKSQVETRQKKARELGLIE